MLKLSSSPKFSERHWKSIFIFGNHWILTIWTCETYLLETNSNNSHKFICLSEYDFIPDNGSPVVYVILNVVLSGCLSSSGSSSVLLFAPIIELVYIQFTYLINYQ